MITKVAWLSIRETGQNAQEVRPMTNPFYIMTLGLAAIAITGTIVANYEDAKQSGRPPHMRIYWWHRVRLILFRIIFGSKEVVREAYARQTRP